MKTDVSGFSSTNLTIYALFTCRDNELAHGFRRACIGELEKRGELSLAESCIAGQRPFGYELPPAECTKLAEHFSKGHRGDSIENTIFKHVLRVPDPWLAMTVDLTQLSSVNLTILRNFTYGYTSDHSLPVEGVGNRLRNLCGNELTRRGHLIEGSETATDSYQLPPEEQAILIKHFGPSERGTSIEDDIFTKILKIPNPWAKGGDKRKRK